MTELKYNTKYNEETKWTEVKVEIDGVDFSEMTIRDMDKIDVLDASLSVFYVTGNTFFVHTDYVDASVEFVEELSEHFKLNPKLDESLKFDDGPFEVVYYYGDEYDDGDELCAPFIVSSGKFYNEKKCFDDYGPEYIKNFLISKGFYEEDGTVFDEDDQNLSYNDVEEILKGAKSIRFTSV